VAPPADHRTGTFKLAGRRSEKMREAAELLSLEKLRERKGRWNELIKPVQRFLWTSEPG
jgi:hypothetical protein